MVAHDDARTWNHAEVAASLDVDVDEKTTRRYQGADLFYWPVHSGPELDLLSFDGQRRLGFEFKPSDAPRLTSSMEQSVELLSIDRLSVAYPGERRHSLSEKVEVVPLVEAATGS